MCLNFLGEFELHAFCLRLDQGDYQTISGMTLMQYLHAYIQQQRECSGGGGAPTISGIRVGNSRERHSTQITAFHAALGVETYDFTNTN